MAITMRKGAYADFDPSKMKAGEWAVSTDTDSNKQQVWMCFSPGVVKRMGTVEDFDTEIQILIRQYLDGMAESVEKAQESAELATSKAQESANSASNAKASETNSAKSELEAKKYADQVKEISESFSGALRPLGTINFADLPSTADASSGDMYNITNQFTTTTDFKEGAGNIIPAGSNVYLTVDRYWDVLAGAPVTGVKGNTEKTYRRGNVNITPANIGALATTGNASNTTVTFAEPSTRANLVSGEKVSVGFGKIKKWFADLKSFAFKDLVNNLTTTTTGSALDASQGKILNDKYDELNSNLSNNIDFLVTINPSYEITVSDQNCFYNKGTKHVHVLSKFSYASGLNSSGVWGYIPNDYKPTKNIPFKCVVRTTSGWETGIGYINTSGQIKQNVTTTATIIIVEADYYI